MSTSLDLVGTKFGRWEVVGYSGRPSSDRYDRYWKCKCKCGTVRDVLGRSLLRGNSQSCGCSRREKAKPKVSRLDKDALMIGKRFGRWTVESRATDYVIEAGNRYDQWNCICDCGTRKIVLGSNLINGKSVSCGCYKSEMAKKRGKEQRLVPKFTTLSREPSLEDILNITVGEGDCQNAELLAKAVVKMFPFYWRANVRDEQSVIGRYGRKEHTICEKCGKKAKLDFHHIKPVSDYGGNEPENVAWLCRKCHMDIERGWNK